MNRVIVVIYKYFYITLHERGLFFVFFNQVRPQDMKALMKQEEYGKLKIEDGDTLTIIDGQWAFWKIWYVM